VWETLQQSCFDQYAAVTPVLLISFSVVYNNLIKFSDLSEFEMCEHMKFLSFIFQAGYTLKEMGNCCGCISTGMKLNVMLKWLAAVVVF
jgi:hypothetical protein